MACQGYHFHHCINDRIRAKAASAESPALTIRSSIHGPSGVRLARRLAATGLRLAPLEIFPQSPRPALMSQPFRHAFSAGLACHGAIIEGCQHVAQSRAARSTYPG
jgi:hypothetical protein